MLKDINIYFYHIQPDSIHWVKEYKSLYYEHLMKLGANVRYVDKLDSLDGFLILGHYNEYIRFKKEKNTDKIKTIAQSNATALNPFIYQITKSQEIKFLYDIDINITARKKHTQILKSNYLYTNIYTVGFPIRIPKKKSYTKTKGLAVIAGRLTPDKLVYESLRIAIDEILDIEKIIVCYPKSQKDLLQYYPKRKIIDYQECDNEKLLKYLEKAEYYIISSLGDTSSVSTVEALYRCCKLITSEYRKMPSHFPYYYDNQKNLEYYNPKQCAKKLLDIIKNYQPL